ncbi:bifunctional DNA primase/polymerase [Anaeromyxobacter soli]|uniref:bifunctional DNA primase/polymerase n=1 Tax=Anaeromyxobacter soli TaxID=2922725 RepID=UPI001FB048DF|nr:bifunctional DNA primase/polymerase [Anaeromyxobacter sp. SG29]
MTYVSAAGGAAADAAAHHRGQIFKALTVYARLGWKVFEVHYAYQPPGDEHAPLICTCGDLACRNVGKHPAYKDYAANASSSLANLEYRWFQSRDSRRRGEPWNIGLLTGEASGVWILDVDNKQDEGGANGARELEILVATRGPLPKTIMAQSGSQKPGTRHLFFKHDPRIRSSLGCVRPGLDVLAGGNRLAVLPPSRHKSRNRYLFFEGHTPDQTDVATAPEWLIQEILAAQARLPAPVQTRATSPLRGAPRASRGAWFERDASGSFARAALEYNHANTPDEWPRRRGACPVCGSPDGFILLYEATSSSAAWWNCKSTRHHATQCGRQSELDGSWGGTALDVDAYDAGMGVREYLTSHGYLAE